MTDGGDFFSSGPEANEIVGLLLEPGAIVGIEGPSGSGKTVLAEQVARLLDGEGFQVINLLGDYEYVQEPLMPFYRWLKTRDAHVVDRRREQHILAPVKDIGRIFLVGETLSALVQGFLHRKDRYIDFLSHLQVDMLSSLQWAHSGSPVLVIADNVHWFDHDSIETLIALTHERVRAEFQFAREARILFVRSVDQVTRTVEAKFLFPNAQTFSTRRPTITNYRSVFNELAPGLTVDDVLMDSIYACTAGHLKLTKEAIDLLRSDPESLREICQDTSATASFALELLERRLFTLKSMAGPVRTLLALAACSGLACARDEVSCAYPDPEIFEGAMEAALRETFMTNGDEIRFKHDVLRKAFNDSNNSADNHVRLGECIRKLRPGDYMRRFYHAARGGRIDLANKIAALILIRFRQGQISMSKNVIESLEKEALPYADEIQACYDALSLMDAGRHREALSVLPPRKTSHDLVQSEISYLRALNYFKLRSHGGYIQAQQEVVRWLIRKDEYEVWVRFAALNCVVLSHLGDKSAQEAYLRLIDELQHHPAPGSSLKRREMALERQAPIFFVSDLALPHVQAAAKYFSPAPGTSIPEEPFQYTAALTNLSGLLYCTGEFEAAQAEAAKGLELIISSGIPTRHVEIYKLLNNYCISAFRAKKMTAKAVSNLLALVTDREGGSMDRALAFTNLATLRVLGGGIREGREMLERMVKHVQDENLDIYYKLYIFSNAAAARHLDGDAEAALQIWERVPPLIDKMECSFEPYLYRDRFRIISEAFNIISQGDVENWDAFVMRAQQINVSPSWASVKFGLLLSDIQVWSES